MSSDRWLTYSDAAALLGMTPDSLRARARRERWGKRLNNEGKATVLVPSDVTPAPDHAASDSSPPPRTKHSQHGRMFEQLAQIVELKARIEELRPLLDAERGERHAERGRADSLANEFADVARRFADAVTANNERADAERARADALEAEMEKLRRQRNAGSDGLRVALSHAREIDHFVRLPRWRQIFAKRPVALFSFQAAMSRTVSRDAA